MADSKITALTAISTVDPTADPLVIVDVSDTSMAASGTTKKSTINQLLGAGGTATLASATITGAASVGTTLGVTGVSTFAAGTALLPALTTTGDTNTGIYYPSADTFAVTTGGSERYRVDASGNLLVGTTTAPTLGKLHVANGIQVSGSGTGGFITSRDGTDQNAYLSLGSNFGVANSYDIGLAIANIAAAAGKRITITNRTAGVYLDDGGTSWNAVSDERFKDIIEPISNAVSKVGLLRSVIGKLKTDDASKRRSFLIAQDVQTVLPEAVDASNPDQLGLAYTDIIPLLVAAIKELTARVQTLETR